MSSACARCGKQDRECLRAAAIPDSVYLDRAYPAQVVDALIEGRDWEHAVCCAYGDGHRYGVFRGRVFREDTGQTSWNDDDFDLIMEINPEGGSCEIEITRYISDDGAGDHTEMITISLVNVEDVGWKVAGFWREGGADNCMWFLRAFLERLIREWGQDCWPTGVDLACPCVVCMGGA